MTTSMESDMSMADGAVDETGETGASTPAESVTGGIDDSGRDPFDGAVHFDTDERPGTDVESGADEQPGADAAETQPGDGVIGATGADVEDAEDSDSDTRDRATAGEPDADPDARVDADPGGTSGSEQQDPLVGVQTRITSPRAGMFDLESNGATGHGATRSGPSGTGSNGSVGSSGPGSRSTAGGTPDVEESVEEVLEWNYPVIIATAAVAVVLVIVLLVLIL